MRGEFSGSRGGVEGNGRRRRPKKIINVVFGGCFATVLESSGDNQLDDPPLSR